LLERAAKRHPDRGVALFDRRARNCERRSYPELLAAARESARRWAALGVEPGDRVVACLPSSWSLVDAWLGALLRGALPVAVAPPAGVGASTAALRHLDEAVGTLTPRHLVCGGRLVKALDDAGLERASAVTLDVEAFESQAPAGSFTAHAPRPEDTAFLQLTSGSTGAKRAVVIPHRAALHNARASDLAIGAPKGRACSEFVDAMVSWLPLHHDMGLVGCLFFSIACGFDLWLLPPEAFLARPQAWLRELSARGTTITAAPNFAFGLCVERAKRDELDGLDLSRWSDAMVGAEMIRPDTMASFSETFAPQGFNPLTLRPCYGLAEGTLAVTFDQRGEGVRTRKPPAESGGELSEVVSTGTPIVDTEVRITDESGEALEEGEVGEVRVQGPGVFDGYWNDAAATAEGLKDGWLCTGDLGFLHEGELHLVGRRKEILIVRGENLMPHELEWIAEEVTGSGGACRAGAFSVPGPDGEDAVLVVESPSRDDAGNDELATAIAERVGRELSLPLAGVRFVKRGSIPKTTSGKVQRRELRRRYLAGELGGSGD
jgi:acyl-CoA synthetase (AMP-forming)/AMP-acid ligase II